MNDGTPLYNPPAQPSGWYVPLSPVPAMITAAVFILTDMPFHALAVIAGIPLAITAAVLIHHRRLDSWLTRSTAYSKRLSDERV